MLINPLIKIFFIAGFFIVFGLGYYTGRLDRDDSTNAFASDQAKPVCPEPSGLPHHDDD